MRQYVYILTDENRRNIADYINSSIFSNGIYVSDNAVLTTEIVLSMAECTPLDYFYVIIPTKWIVFDKFNFDFIPEAWDSKYMHIWNNDATVRLFSKKHVLENPELYSDKSLHIGNTEIKNIDTSIYCDILYDIIFLSYDEINADKNFNKIKSLFPRTKRVHGVAGIFNAHIEAAKKANTPLFYVVDADAEIIPTFDFSYIESSHNHDSVHIWHSRNPINDLEYGYGGVKLFPRDKLLSFSGDTIDFTTTVTKDIIVIPEVSNITKFNTDPFSAWRAGFRECTKLASGIIKGHNKQETENRLHVWKTVGQDREFGDFTIEGAIAGEEFGRDNFDKPDIIKLINDYNWLEKRFNS